MIQVSSDLAGIGNYIGAVEGILSAVEEPGFEEGFLESMTNRIKKAFMAETIAAHESGYPTLNHVFEWGNNQGETSNIPLFGLTKTQVGTGEMILGFEFLPSTAFVPLPDPSRYRFNPAKLQFMSRHVFVLKALIMETQSSVSIAPRNGERLFIPMKSASGGYVMTTNDTQINPGGSVATGGFSRYWSAWFETRAPVLTTQYQRKAESALGDTGRKAIRYAAGTKINGVSVGGRFASGVGVSIGYINAKQRTAQRFTSSKLRAEFNEVD